MSDSPNNSLNDDTNDNVDETVSIEECLSKANTYKSAGNDFYKQSKFVEASESYENGITWVNKISNLDSSHKQLLSILYSNLCASYLENRDYSKARDSADKAITNNKDNVKAYYRRAQALFNIGSFEEALKDCNYLLEVDKNDPNVNNLVRKINLKLKTAKQEQKKAFGGLFDKVGGLYDDRQIEMQNKKQKKYQDYLKSQREKGETEMDFEAWEKYDEEEEAKKEVERTNKVKAEDEKPKEKNTVDETIEFDEEDEKIMNETKKMGYCYFGKKKDEGAKKVSSNHTSGPVLTPVSSEVNVQDASKRAISSWNSQGTTYEEKDMTTWCKRKLEEVLLKSSYVNEPDVKDSTKNILDMFNDINLDNLDNNGLSKLQKLAGMICKSSVKTTSVDSLEGDAQIAFIRGTRRYLFDFSCNLNVSISIDTGFENPKLEYDNENDNDEEKENKKENEKIQLSKYEGVVSLKEISSERETGKTWKDYMYVNYKSKMKTEHQDLVKDLVEKYKDNVSERIDEFLEQYKTQ